VELNVAFPDAVKVVAVMTPDAPEDELLSPVKFR